MEFFKHNTAIDFMAQRKISACLSIALCLASLIVLFVNGLNWGLDFTGGTQLQLHFESPVDVAATRQQLELSGLQEAVITHYGTPKEILISLPPTKDAKTLTETVLHALPGAALQEVNYIGPQVGEEMITKGIVAIIIALLGTMIYIALRFNVLFSIGSTVALIHDPIIILGVFSLWHLEFNLITLAAVLTVIGYSLNDTIVIFDRVRENFRKLHQSSPIEVMNQAINQTLSRTIMTSALTLTVVIALLCLGGHALHGFALALMIGIVVGTYSSIYVAGSLTLALGLKREHLLPKPKLVDDRP